MKMDAQDAGRDFDGWFSAGKFLLLLGLLLLVFFPGILLGTSAFFYRDAGLFSYPVAYYLRDSIRAGHWPLWNPYNNCGLPFLAQWNTLALYPASLLYVALPFPWSLNVFLLGHILWAGWGAYALGFRWFGSRFGASVAGLAFAWNGLSLHCLMWPCHIAALAWMPWVILLGERAATEGGRAVFLPALASAFQLATGSPEIILFTWLVIAGNAALAAWRQETRWFTAGGRLLAVALLAASISAAQLLPWLDLVMHSDRSRSFGGSDWSLPLWGVANFFVPLFHAQSSVSGVFMQAEQQWTSSYYLGVLPLLLVLVALGRGGERVLLLAALALGGIVLALGDAGFVLPIMKRCLPLLGFSRYPIKFIVLTIFALSLLAGAGAAWLQNQPAALALRGLRTPGVLLAMGILLILAIGLSFPFSTDSLAVFWPNTLARLLVLAGGIALLGLLYRWIHPLWRWLPAAAFLLLAGIDAGIHAPPQNPPVAAQAYAAYPPSMSPQPVLGEARVMLSSGAEETMEHLVNPDPLRFYLGQRAELFSDCNLLEGIPKVDGFFSLHLAWEQKLAGLLRAGKGGKLSEFLGVSQVASAEHLFVWEVKTNFMHFATIGQKPVFMDDDQVLKEIDSSNFSPRQIVYLPLAAKGEILAGADPGARVLSSKVTPSECLFTTVGNGPAMLVVAQSYYHCWKASVDGKPVKVWRANYAFQAVEVPTGRHEVRLKYTDHSFWAGAALSVSALGLCLAGCFKNGGQTVQGAR